MENIAHLLTLNLDGFIQQVVFYVYIYAYLVTYTYVPSLLWLPGFLSRLAPEGECVYISQIPSKVVL